MSDSRWDDLTEMIHTVVRAASSPLLDFSSDKDALLDRPRRDYIPPRRQSHAESLITHRLNRPKKYKGSKAAKRASGKNRR